MSAAIRVLCANVGPRWSSVSSSTAKRRGPRLIDTLQAFPDGPPGILILQECVKSTQQLIERELGYIGYGNGVHKMGRQDIDRSGDNGVILWDPKDYAWTRPFVYYVGHGPTNTFVRAVRLTRRKTGDWVDVAVTHPPNGVVTETFRMKQIRALAKQLRTHTDAGYDFTRMVWGADWNSSKMYPERGVRSLLRKEFGLNDVRAVLSADAFAGNSTNSAHGFNGTKHDGRQIDAILVGPKVRARAGGIYRTDAPPQKAWSCDHNWVYAHLTIGEDPR